MRESHSHFVLSITSFCVIALALSGCRPQLPPGGDHRSDETGLSGESGPITDSQTPDNPNPNVGAVLYKAAEMPSFPLPVAAGTEPIVIPNVSIMFEDRQTVSAETDGTIELIATPMTRRADGVYEYRLLDGTVVTHDPRNFDPRKLHPKLEFNPREIVARRDHPEDWVPYYKLRDGDWVANDQLICMLDDSLMLTRREAAKQNRKAAEEGINAAKQGVELTEKKMALYKDRKDLFSQAELLIDQITLTRFVENLAQSASAIAKAQGEYDEAGVMLNKHRIKSRVNGFIRNVAKHDGEYVHAGEKIFEIQSTETIRLEGTMDVQYYDRVKRNMAVTVEPAVPSSPLKSHALHNLAVSGVAITGHSPRPMIVSVGLDGKAIVWDPNLDHSKDAVRFPHNLPHPVAVRSVACTPPGARVLAITGAEDGKVRIWNLTDPAKLPTNPLYEPEDYHASSVTAIAVSPDGKFAATAAGREIFIWELTSGKKLYSLPPEHRDNVTSLSFTPQTHLVTASRDRTLKVWKLGTGKAAVMRTIDHRSGVVDTLGVSPDGGRVLFDQDKGRIDLVDLTNSPTRGQTIGQLSNVGPSVAFSTLAVFGPDHAAPGTPAEQLPPYTIATAGGEGDLKGGLQVWQVSRGGGRAAEMARLATHGRAGVTCAAFSPHKESRFIVAGTERGSVQVWVLPSGAAKKHEGRITYLEVTDPRYATVRVEMSNKDLGLVDRSSATVIINPGH
ncbi:MAG TPA: HlyD family efflux transporter periplasmic adaptor subunit [Gemmata sp.]|nr:HlyD family efflux transporter periplasmic adaptor subunit [Gemmata sp.]